MRRLVLVLTFVFAASLAGAFFRRPNHVPPKFPDLTAAQREALQKLQVVIPEVGYVPTESDGPDLQVQGPNEDAAKNIVTAQVPRLASAKGAAVLKAVNREMRDGKDTWRKRLPLLGILLAFIFVCGYGFVKYMDIVAPYSKKKARILRARLVD